MAQFPSWNDSEVDLLRKIADNSANLATIGANEVIGPSSSTDNAIARFDGTTGKTIQNSLVTIDDSGNIQFGADGLAIRFANSGGNGQILSSGGTLIISDIAGNVGVATIVLATATSRRVQIGTTAAGGAGAGMAIVGYTDAATSSITGSLIVGTIGTAATSVGIGGGSIFAGAGISALGASVATSAVTQISMGSTGLLFINSGGASDEKVWDIATTTTQLQFRLINDAINNASGWMTVSRTGFSTPLITMNGALTLSAGTLTKLGGATLITTSTALTDTAGAQVGTLTNAPTAGNPTKWIAINDNGTTRKIPTWT